MKSTLKRALRDEAGAALVLTLVLMLVGGLVVGPLLGFMGSGLLAGKVYERRTDELYAADAGVEDAIWLIQNRKAEFDSDGWYVYPDPLIVNEKTVDVRVFREDLDPTCREELRYRVVSTATDDSTTMIEAYLGVRYMDFSSLLDYAIVSRDIINLQPNVHVWGDVWLPDDEHLYRSPGAEISGTICDSTVELEFPSFDDDLSSYYWGDVTGVDEYYTEKKNTVSIRSGTTQETPHIIGPLLAEGELTIRGDGWVELAGTIYIIGDLQFTAANEIHLNLNGQTIFVDGNIVIGTGVTLYGSGCIIARQDIDFAPNLATEDDEFVLVMSTDGTVRFNPNGRFTGSVVGSAKVNLQPDKADDFFVQWVTPEGHELHFPMGVIDIDDLPAVTGLSILSWRIDTSRTEADS
jgi:hypothetical protein